MASRLEQYLSTSPTEKLETELTAARYGYKPPLSFLIPYERLMTENLYDPI